MELLKWIHEELKPHILHVINQWWTTGQGPDEITTARVASIYKKGNPAKQANYRPMSLLTTMHIIQNNRKPHTTTAFRRHRKRDAKNSIRLPPKPQHHRRDTRHPQNHGQSRTHRTRARHHTTGLGKSIRQNHPHQPHAYTQKIPST